VRALVTGADGFVGRHLVAHLRAAGDEVHEVVGNASGGTGPHRDVVDVRDHHALAEVVVATGPDIVYHLAAVAYGPDAQADLDTAVSVTIGGTVHLLEAAVECGSRPKVVITGSSEVYGAPGDERIAEDAPVRPINLYGATKAAQEVLGLAFGKVHSLAVVATRSFNHIGPGQRESFAVASFARQLADIHAGRQAPEVRVGNLAPVRDFADVRDVVRAYRLLATSNVKDRAVNVASGEATSVRDILHGLIDASGLEVRVGVDPARVRATDAHRIVGDPTLLHHLTGWTPRIPLSQTLRDVWLDALERWG